MRCGCIDIGTNTTRVLVAETRDGQLTPVLQHKAFTRLGRGLAPGGAIPEARIAETAAVVAEQRALAEQAGACEIRVVATAVIRRASNRDAFCDAVARHGGVEVSVLDGEQEARLAFLGATRTFAAPLPGRVAVVDVGGGSTEVAVGTVAGGVEWAASYPFGSGFLADTDLGEDPPCAGDLDRVRAHAARALAGMRAGSVDMAVAVGGSAASLPRLVGDRLDGASLATALGLLCGGPASDVALRHGLDEQRVRLMPAGLVALGAVSEALGRPLHIGCGGLREGVLLDLAGL
jgi:exopolyphosphatase / guanosine-5'-triphosphate,3'-diphosphate pyrophosphatase